MLRAFPITVRLSEAKRPNRLGITAKFVGGARSRNGSEPILTTMKQPPTKTELRRPWRRWVAIVAMLCSFGSRHSRWFAMGAFSALWVVGLRLVLPWPLRALMEPSLAEASRRSAGLLGLVPAGWDPAMTMSGLFLVIILLLGLMDYAERLFFARFAIGSIRDLRADAFRKARATEGLRAEGGSGDLVARLIGDTARLKAGLKGFLVHVATNGALFLGVTLIALWIDGTMGLIFVATVVSVGLATLLGARSMYVSALKFRTKEGKLADFIQDSWDNQTLSDFAEVNESSGHHEAALTQIQGRTTCFAHVILGLGIVSSLAYGANAVANETLPAGDLLILAMYALMIRSPIIQLSRQGSRTGKILACGDRLARLVTSDTNEDDAPIAALGDAIRLEGVRVVARRAKHRVRRLGPIDLEISAGERIAILGKPGSGKSTLLELLAGAENAQAGKVSWDGIDVSTRSAMLQSSGETSLLSGSPSWAPRRIRELLGVEGNEIEAATRNLLRICGATSLMERLPENLYAKLESSALSVRERLAVALAVMIRSTASVWLLDDPVASLEKRKAVKVLKKVLRAGSGATVVVAMSRPVGLKKFERVIEMRRGRVVFDGTPTDWRAARGQKKAETDSSEAVSQG